MDAPPYPGKLSLYFSNRHAVKPLTARWNDCAHPTKKDPCFCVGVTHGADKASTLTVGASDDPARLIAWPGAAEGL